MRRRGIVATAPTLTPRNLAEVREVMRDTAGPLLFRGSGTKLDWGAEPAAETNAVISSTAMTALLTYDAPDATVSVQAGMALSDLQRILAEHNQWLAIDPPCAETGATVGGIFTAGDSGPSRLAYGTLRDLVIGATYVLSDGTIGRTGGHVIKNVAGYDMAKLLCGSLGTLAFVAELVLRVHPRPAASRTLRVPADAVTAARISAALAAAPIEPVAVEWAEQAVWIRLTGHPDAVAAQTDDTAKLIAAEARRSPNGSHGGPAVDVLADADERTTWQRLTAALAGDDGETVVRGACLPTQLPIAADALTESARAAGVEAGLSAHAVLGLMTARLSGADVGRHAACVTAWRERLRALGGHAVVRRRLEGGADAIDVWGPPPASIALMRQVKHRLDPANRCAPGRFVGGI